MGLSEDQRAMLQLILERGQDYEDIGSLLGIEEGEVRERARVALAEIGGADPDAEVALTDYLLGQADPIGRADAARYLRSDPEANALARKLEAQLKLMAPGAELPELPEARPTARRGIGGEPVDSSSGDAPVSQPGVSGGSAAGSTALSPVQRRLIAGLVLGGVALLAIVLVVAGAFDGGGDASGADTTSAQVGQADSSLAASDRVTKAILAPIDGGEGRGVALFGRVRGVPVIQVTALGLEPVGSGEDYYVWLYANDKLALRVGGFEVDGKGRALTQIRVPTEALALVANGTFDQVEVTLTSNQDYRDALETARRKKSLPSLTGTGVLRGDITGPIVGAAKRAGGGGGND